MNRRSFLIRFGGAVATTTLLGAMKDGSEVTPVVPEKSKILIGHIVGSRGSIPVSFDHAFEVPYVIEDGSVEIPDWAPKEFVFINDSNLDALVLRIEMELPEEVRKVYQLLNKKFPERSAIRCHALPVAITRQSKLTTIFCESIFKLV